MANAIRYSTTGDTQSLKSGNFYFGVGDVGKGPSSATTYYNGSTPVASGYTVYSFDNTQTSRISYVSPTSDSEFISITNAKSGQNFTGVTQCLNWYVTQNDHVVVNKDYESIVTNGLVMNLDASYDPSYTSSGTTWYDIAYSGNNGTLVNGPTFNPLNEGSIVFDGVDDEVNTSYGPTLGDFTIGVWFKDNGSGQYGRLVDKSYQNGFWLGRRESIANNWGGGIKETQFPYGRFITLTDGQWNYLVSTRSGTTHTLYGNGFRNTTGGTVTATALDSTTISIGAWSGPENTQRFKGDIPIVQVYNRALSVSEIIQNYQATFPRFLGKNIVMNGLVNLLDAGYNASYPGFGTTWTNISGVSGGTGTLTNGPTYSTDGGGSIVFDGVDDYVSVSGITSPVGVSDFSIDVWVKLNSIPSSNPRIISLGSDNNNYFNVGTYGGGSPGAYDTFWFEIKKSGSYYGGFWNSNRKYMTGGWYNLVGTSINSSNTMNFYINGIPVSGTGVIGGGPSLYNTMLVGAHTLPPYQSLNALIPEIKYYNRALSPSEILQNYQAQLPTIVGENFITNGLVLYLDAGYRSSYPTTGTTWNNVSGVSGGTNTLVNGPVYSGTSGGTITFDGVDDYADFNAPNLGTTTTVEMWCKIGSNYINRMFFGWNLYDVFCGGGNLGFNTAASDVYGISSSVVSSLGLVNNWKHYVFEMRSDVSYTNNKIYINGVSQTLSQRIGSESVGNRNFNNGNGRIASWRQSTDYIMPMECAVFKVYNRALTQNEINQNFNATKSRFGI
jgi:hypothetical protein